MLQLRQIKSYLTKEFFPFISLSSDDLKRSQVEQENIKYSRSLVALSICMQNDVSSEEATKNITDSYTDNGIDGLYHDSQQKILYLIQSKFHNDGSGSIELGDTHKFLKGIKDLVNAKYEKFNDAIKKRKGEIEKCLLDIQTRFVVLIIYSGQQGIAPAIKKEIDEFLEENNALNDSFSFVQINLKDIYSFISRGAAGNPIDAELAIYNWNHVTEPIESYYGQVAGSDLAQLFMDNGRKLFSPNIRVYLGDTEVNQGILETIEKSPAKFWYYNNGITALCDNINKKPIGGTGSNTGYFVCKNLRIVNGAQTVGSIAQAFKIHPVNTAEIRIWIRIFAVSEDKGEESKKITRTNNTQNRIDSRDFISLDPEQDRLHNELLVDGIIYLYKSGEVSQPGQIGFDLNEATVARACVNTDVQLTVQAKREISKLWEDIEKAPYKILFNNSLNGINLAKEVNILKKVESLIDSKKASTEGKEKLFVTHGNRFLLHLVYQKLIISNELYNDPTEEKLKIYFEEVYETLLAKTNELHPESVLGSLFKNTSKCKELKTYLTS